MFDALKIRQEIVAWIRNWFVNNGPGCNAVIGISGGKDSTVAAALCVEALGKDRVIGVMMPNGIQKDLDDAVAVCKCLGIRSVIHNIEQSVNAILSNIVQCSYDACDEGCVRVVPLPSEQTKINLPPRIRMATLYAVSQSVNGRVVNTCNLSEEWIGYSTRWGDNVGDFAPLQNLTTEEVVAIGDTYKELSYTLVHKIPADGLCEKTDEDNTGIPYSVLNKYLRTGVCEDVKIREKIDAMHTRNMFKLKPIPSYLPDSCNV